MAFSRALPNSVLVRFLCSLILWFASEQVLALGCTASYTYTNNGTSTNYSLTSGQSLKINSGTYTGNINSFPSNTTICVETGATFRPNSLNSPAGSLINYGTTNLATFSYGAGALIDNYGLLNFIGGVNFNGATTIRNRSAATTLIENSFTLDSGSLLENNGLLIAKQDFNTSSGTTVNNNYRFEIEGNFNPSGILTNYGRLYVKKFINANSDFSFNNYCTLVSYDGFNNNSLFFSNWGTILVTSASGAPGGLWQNNQSFYNGDGAKVAGGNFTNNGVVSGYGALVFSGETRNQGTFTGSSAVNPINFYDETQTGSLLFDFYNLPATNTIRSLFARPTELDAPTTCNNTYKSFAALNACPASGVVQNQTGTVTQASGNGALVENVSQAIGALQALGTTATASNAAKIIAGGVLTLDLGQVVPADAPISISLARVDTARVRVEVSLDGVVFSNKGTFGSSGTLGTSPLNVLARLVVNANPGGTQYIRLTREAGSMWVDGAEYSQVCVESRDYGDAPASYGVAGHKLVSTNLYLGDAVPDAESASSYSVRANGDGNDEDGPPPQAVGAVIPSFAVLQMTDMSYSTTIRTTNQTGTVAKLTGWIDFDKNGSFDADERASVDVPTGSNNTNTTLTWSSIPTDISLGTTYVRLRFTTDATAALQATGIAPNGEVEDFILPIHMDIPPNSPSISIASAATSLACQPVVFQDDFNDLTPADTNYWGVNRAGALPVRSWTASGGGVDTYARFIDWGLGYGTSIYFGNGDVRSVSPSLGNGFSFDAQGKLLTIIDALALRDSIDDLEATGAIRESHWGVMPVTLSRSFATTAGKTYRLYFSALRETGDFLPGIMRVDAPGGSIHFKAPGGTEGVLDYAIDFTATSSNSSISFVNYGHFGPNSGGYCNVVNNAWCTVGGLDNNGKSANELSIDNVKLVEAACTTGGIGGYVYQDNNLNNTYDMGTETTIPAMTVKIYDEKGSSTDFTDDRLVATQSSFADGHYLFEHLDASASYRVEVDAADPDLPNGLTIGTPNPSRGLVPLVNNIKTVNFGFDPAGAGGTKDYGDAPATYGNASHVLVSGLQLGINAPDAESSSQPSFNALGDGYDEDGAPHILAPSGPAEAARFPVLKLTDTSYTLPYTVTNSTGSLAQLYAWIDFDKNGSFEADEATSVAVPTGSVNSVLNLTWSSIPSDIKLGTSFIRVRLTTDSGISINTPTGSADSGEVEDYPLAIYQPIAPDSQSISIVNNASPLACQQTVFQDNFNDISGTFNWGFYVPGSQDIRNWVRSGGGPDTYADVKTVIPAQQASVYFGNGAVRGIAPNFFNGFSFDSSGHLVSPIEAIALRDVPDDFNLGVGMSQWGPEPMRLTRSFNTQAGKTYRLYFKAIPEQGSFVSGVMRVDAPGGSIHFKAPGGTEAIQSYAIEFTATASTSTIAFVNYGHVASDWCDPQTFDWCTTGGTQNGTAQNELIIDDVVLAEAACSTGTISGRVYLDANKNDSYDPTETGINAIKVSLYDQNGTVNDPNDDRLVYTTNSDSSGVYSFSTVDTTRTYRLEVDSSDTDLPSGTALGTPNPLLSVAVAANATTANQNFGFDVNTTNPALGVVGEYRFDDCGSGGWQLDSSGNNNSAIGTAQIQTDNYKNYACTAVSNVNWNMEVPDQANYALASGAVSILFYDHKGVWASARLLEKGWTADQKLSLEMKPSTDWQHGTVSVNLNGNVIDTGETYYTSLGNGSLNDTQWVHAVLSFGPAGMKLYINGVLKGSNAYTGGITGVLGNFRLPGVEGYFDEFYIFNQQPTDAQVSTLYSNLLANKTWDGNTRTCNCSGGVSADYGDAPASYGEVSHQIVNGIYLGDNPPDVETSSKYSFNARADNYDDGAPQQAASGVYIPLFPVLQLTDSSYSVNFKVTNLTGTAGKLHGWIDFDKSGTFEADEAAVVDVPSGASNATATLNWTSIPLDIQLGTVALRLRLSTDASVVVSTPTGSANDGEVEDYPIAIAMDIPPNSPSLAIVNGATPAACEAVVFQDNFNDLTPGLFWGFNRPGNQAVRDWDRSGGGNDTYAHITSSSATDRSIYFGNGGVRQISPSIGTGFSFDANGKLLTVIDAIALRDDMDDIISPGTTVNEYGSKADWGPEPVKFSRSFATVEGKTYRLYFKAKPEDPAGTYESGIMRLDMPGGSLHFKAPGSAEGVQSYAVEFTATSNSSVISFINYGHVENDNNKYCDPNSVFGNNVWCTVGGRTDGKVANELIIDDVVLTEAACATGSIRGRVYLDSDQDNNYDAGIEAGLSAITVSLYDENGTTGDYSDDRLVNTKSTYVNGEYDFTEVNTSRSYRLEVDTNDNDLPVHTVIGTTNPLTNRTVAANTLLDHQHFGFDLMNPSKIAGTVYLDNNTNDSFNPGIDYGLGNITVSLHTMAGALVASTQTAINGKYQFANLDHNLSYRITVDGTDTDLPPGATLGTVNPIPNISVPQNSTVTKDVGFDQAANGITGRVFLDYNLNGQLDSQSAMSNFANTMNIGLAFDKGIANAQIKAECVGAAGKLSFGPVTSDVNGQYYLATPGAVAGNYNCILQLTTIPSGYTVATQSGSGQQVLTQVVSPNAVNTYFALQQEMSYCQNNPDLAVNRFAYGQQTANAPFAGNNDVANIFAFPYNSGTAGVPNTLPAGYNHPLETDNAFKDLALANQVGSVFGLGWHPSSHSLFASAYMKAWTGFGSGGTGGIYRVDLSNPSSPVSSLYANLNQIFPATPPTVGSDPYLTGIFSSANPGYVQIADGSSAPDGSYVASGNATRDNQDGQIAAAVGKTAFGDLDVSADGKSLFVVNMANNKLYILPVRSAPLTAADAGLISSYSIPFAANCRVNGTKRAFGLGEYEGGLYVATECGAEYGYTWEVSEHSVFRFDLQSKTFSTTPSLVYARPSEDTYGIIFSLITDLVFDPAGQMILTFRNNLSSSTDTTADDGKGSAYSVIRRACIQDKAAYRWEKENNASCGGVTTPGKDAGYGTGPSSGTFFYQEYPADNGPALRAASYGGAAQIPGFMEMAYTVSEPFEFYSVGVSWVDTGLGNPATAGQRNRAYSFYQGTGAFDYPDNRPINGKNAAIGDLEVLCDTPSLEIGNRVWQDSDSDGVQDAGELPVAGVKVELFANGANLASATPLATAVTDANGYYVFSSDMRGYPATGNNAPNDTTGANGGFNAADIQGGRASTTSHKYGLLSLTPNTQYQVVIRNVSGASKQASLGSMTLSTVAQGTDPELDSDAGAVGDHAVANVSMLGYGNHYHALDFGFKAGVILADYGDAPASYGTPYHTIVSGIRLGATAPDGETVAQPSTGANLDDTTGTDDEDGVILPSLTQGQTATFTTTVAGAGGYLQGWIDWNGDGDFADSGEQVATNIQDNLVGDTNNALGTIAFSVAVPANSVTTPTYARFRWSTTISLNAIIAAVNGEVEDYTLTVVLAPASAVIYTPPPTYQVCKSTSVEQLDAFQYAVATGSGVTGTPSLTYTAPTGSNRFMVAVLSVERDHSPMATRGDNYETNPGVTFPTVSFGGVPMQMLAHSVDSAGTSNTFAAGEISRSYYFYGLYDLSLPNGAQTVQVSGINAPSNAGDESMLAVATFANVASANPISTLDNENSQIDRSAPFNIALVSSPTPPTAADQPPGTTSADNLLLAFGTSSKPESLTTGASWTKLAEIAVNNANGSYATAAGRASGAFTENDGHTLLIQAIKGVSTNQTATMSSSSNNLQSLSMHVFRLVAHGCDYGDAPASYGDAFHSQSWSRRIGAQRGDAEVLTPNTANALGDDNSGLDDEDGASLPSLTTGQTATINVAVTGAAYLSAWVDWNSDGDFNDSLEKIATDLQDTDANGIIPISVTVPTTASGTQTYARFRWAINPGAASTGWASYGEVEDYALTITNPSGQSSLSGKVWFDSNNDGIQNDGTTAYIGGAKVELYNPVTSTIVTTTTTDANGNYQFSSAAGFLPSTSYQLRIRRLDTQKPFSEWNLSTANLGGDDNLDSDAILNGNYWIISFTSPNSGNSATGYGFGFVTNNAQGCLDVGSTGIANDTLSNGHAHAYDFVFAGKQVTGFCAEPSEPSPQLNDSYQVYSSDRLGFSTAQKSKLRRLYSAIQDPNVLFSIARVSPPGGSQAFNQQMLLDHVMSYMSWYYLHYNENMTTIISTFFESNGDYTAEQLTMIRDLLPLIADRVAGTNGQVQYPEQNMFWLWNMTTTTRQDIIIPSLYATEASCAANTSLSGKVWFDSNNDGIQNDGVGAGVEGVKLELFNPVTNTIVATTTTTATGAYVFDTTNGLMPNISYQVRMLKPDNDFPLSDWGVTAKNVGGDPNQDSDAVVNGSYWQVNLVSPNSGQTMGGYDIGLVNTIPQGCLDNGATGVAYVAPSPFYAYNFLFNGKQVSGYCLEVADPSPQANDSFQVNPIDRRGLSASQRSQLARLYSALHDPDIVFPIISVSTPNTMQDNLDALLKYMTWYYSDYNENITSVNNNITDNNSLTAAQKDLYKILAVKIIDRVAGSNGETQYPEQKLYWLWNLTTTARQDIVVPARYIIGGVCTANYVISGKVFEDVNYGGGAGRNASVTGTAGITGTQVELYNSTGSFVSNTTTAANGSYSFSAVPAGNYFVRVVNASVNSTRPGSNGSELGVQTFRTNGTVATTNEVGGRKPDASDAEAHDGTATLNTTTFVFSGGALNGKQAQSVTPVTVAGALSGVDFGFNFDTVVNTNDSGQGSLRQFILNANLLGGEASLAQVGLVAGKERSIFMLPLTDPRYINSDGVANNGDEFWRIPLLNGLPETTGAETVLDASTQAGSQCNPVVGRRLVVELDGSNVSNSTATAITLAGPYNGVRGFAIGSNSGNPFTFGIYLRKRTVFESQTPAHDSVIACNNIGATPSGQAYPVRFYTDAVGIFADNVTVGGSDPADRNIIGSADDDGVESEGNATIIRNNYIGLAADGVSKLPLNDHVVALWPPGSNMTVIDNKLAVTRFGIFSQSSGTTVRNNTIGLTANGQNVVAGGEYLLQFQAGNALAENNVFASGGAGGQPAVILMDGSTFQNNTIGFNSAGISVAGSGSAHVGISLRNAAGTANTPIVINNNTIGNAGSAGIGFNSDVDVPISITRNRIGVAPNGITPASNAWGGIAVNNNASSPVTIGGANLGNIIANNMKAAIAHTGTGIVTVNQNSIYNNTGLGIDLNDDAVTTNDAGDMDVGPNSKLNFPLLQQLVFTNGNLIVRGCAPAGSVVELFEADVSQGGTAAVGANRFGHLFDYGEGQSYLGSFVEGTVVDADTGSCAIPAADGNDNTGMKAFQFSIPVPASVVSGDYLTATATLAAVGTSEFSPTVAVIDGPPPVGSGSCAATGGTDILFIVDNSGSITELEYADFAQTIQTVGSQLLVSNPKNRIAIAHFGGPSDSLVSGGQYVYIERDFSSTAMLAPVRQFAWGGAYNPTWTADHLAGALQQMRYALDGQASTTSSYILSPLKETSRNTASPLQIVLMTDATRYLDLVPNDISMLIDPPGSGAEPDDGSAFTIYNQMKAEGVLFSVASFNADPLDIAASAAIASVGGTYTGNIEANTHDPQGSQVTPRRYVSVTAGFQLTTTQLEELVEGTAICGSSIQGRVFEDPNYGGGAGRPFGTLGTVGVTGASIEVYDQTGNYVASVVSTTDGKYSLPNLPDAPYYVRVVDATVKSSRLGSNGSEIPVLTYRTDGLVTTANQIGGNKPMLADAGVNLGTATLNTTTFLFSGGGLTGKPAQSVQLVNLSGGDLKGVDFGFNFSTVVNTNDSGQGSLRQFLLNNKQLATDGLAQVLPASLAAEYPAGTETSIFMIPATQLTAGQAIITLTSGALSLERMHTAIDGRTQIANIGSGTIVLNNSISNGLNLLASATGSAVRDITVSHAAGSGVLLDDTDNAVIERVTILNNSQYGVSLTNDALNNRIVTNTIAHNAWAGIAHIGSGLGNTYSQNSTHDNGGLGIDLGVDGVTANDDLDVDTGPNRLLNYPVVEAGSSISSNGTKVVAYDFDLDVPTNTHGYRLEFFRNTAVDSSSHGEGEIYLGYVDINHAGGGLLNFKGSLNANQTVPANANIAVTLTEKTSPTSLGSTSEFSGVKNGSVSICTDLINGTGADITVNENAPVITYLESTDDSGNPITYVISGGADSNQFIVQGPELGATLDCQLIVFYKPNVIGARSSALTKALPLIKPGDYEAPTDNGGDNTYNLTITATLNGQAYERPVTVGVKDINEAPEIINETQTEFLEGKMGVALDLESFDPDAGDAEGAGISYALSGGADRARFKLNSQTGELSFIVTPDFEQPVDASNDNIYDIDLRVMDDQGLSSVSSLKIAVTDDKLNDGIYLQTKVLLQGPYIASSGLMQDSLRATGILPISQPYQASPFNYLGTEQLNLDLATVTGKEAVVDWVLIELRDAANPKTIVASKAALVQRDGDVIDALTGSAVLNFPVATGSYLVSVRHRNHLGVRTATAVAFGSQSVMIDFSQTATKVAGVHARLEATNLALLWAGDANNDERLIATGIGSDASEILNVILKTPSNINLNSSYRLLGYLDSDLNMDGVTLFMGPSNDANVLLGNLFLFPSNTGHNSNYIVVGGLVK